MQPRRTGTLHAAGRAAMWPTLAMLLAPLLVLGWAGLVHPARAQVGAPVLVSRDGAGSAGDAQSYEARIDARGRRIAFSSAAANLVPGDGNGVADVFLLDRDGPGLRRISLRSDGRESSGPSGMPALSADGRWLAFVAESALGTEPAPWGGLYLKALDTGSLTLLAVDTDEGRGTHFAPVIDGVGDRVAFLSTVDLDASGVAGGGLPAVFVWQRGRSGFRRIGPADADAGASDLALAADGGWLSFASEASNLIAGEVSLRRQVYVADLDDGGLTRVSVHSDGSPGNGNSLEPTLTADGRLVAFTSYATNLVDRDVNGVSDIFVHDRVDGRTWSVTDVQPGDNVYHPADSDGPSFTADGRCLAFGSGMYTLEPGAPREQIFNIYVHHLVERRTERVSRRADGGRPERGSRMPAIAGSGGSVAFVSEAALLPLDTNEASDIYVTEIGCAVEGAATSAPTQGHVTATPVHGATATPHHGATATPVHGATATPVHGATATPVHGATAGHPTATPVRPEPGQRAFLPFVSG
ncbi:MAG: PD40 domain-containing protein [Chloroflexi bacterium]|nr:PD40 domain-containing protein [Chloroflexota bacterium]